MTFVVELCCVLWLLRSDQGVTRGRCCVPGSVGSQNWIHELTPPGDILRRYYITPEKIWKMALTHITDPNRATGRGIFRKLVLTRTPDAIQQSGNVSGWKFPGCCLCHTPKLIALSWAFICWSFVLCYLKIWLLGSIPTINSSKPHRSGLTNW